MSSPAANLGQDIREHLRVLEEARAAVAHYHDTEADLDPGRLCSALEELLGLFGLSPSPVERREILRAMPSVNPDNFVAMPVMAVPAPPIPVPPQSVPVVIPNTQIGTDPQGHQVLILLFQMVLPMAMFRSPIVLQANGAAQNPVEGMFPMMPGRLLVPIKRLAPEFAEALRAEAPPPSEPGPVRLPIDLLLRRRPWTQDADPDQDE